MQVDVHEAKTHLAQLLKRIDRGEEVIIAENGRPLARLVPLEAPPPRKPGLLKGTLGDAFFEPLPEEELELWES